MLRNILAIIAGLVSWVLVVTVLNWMLRATLPGYSEAEPAMSFSLGMQLARLLIAALSSITAGIIVRAIAPSAHWAPWILGGVLVAVFVPVHWQLWQKFPLWYHLTFLVTLIPLTVLGASLSSRGRGRAARVRFNH